MQDVPPALSLVAEEVQKEKSPIGSFARALPNRGLIKDFYDLFDPTYDGPQEYTLAVAISTLGDIIAGNIKMPYHVDCLFTNLYIQLVGTSSNMRKSTARGLKRRVIFDLGLSDRVLSSDSTPEARFEGLQKLYIKEKGFSPAILMIDEMTEMLTAFKKKDYRAGDRELLCSLYDCPIEHVIDRRSGGRQRIQRPIMSILACSPESTITECISHQDMAGGLLPRFIFVVAKKKKPFVVIPQPPDQLMYSGLISKLKQIMDISGDVKLTGKAFNLYADWAKKNDHEITISMNGRISPFLARWQQVVLKLAMIYHISLEYENILTKKPSEPITLSPYSMELAIDFMEFVKCNFQDFFGRIGESWYEKIRIKVKDFIERKGAEGASRSDLLQGVRDLNKKKLTEVIETLIEAGEVEVIRGEGRAKPRYKRAES